MTLSATLPDPVRSWLDRRQYADLDERAERELRAAGVAFEDHRRAEAHLAAAWAIAAEHRAVIVAHDRFYFYKHRFIEAERSAHDSLALAARALGLPIDHQQVTALDRDVSLLDEMTRFWLFALQAWGSVLLRVGRINEGFAAFEKMIELDAADQRARRRR